MKNYVFGKGFVRVETKKVTEKSVNKIFSFSLSEKIRKDLKKLFLETLTEELIENGYAIDEIKSCPYQAFPPNLYNRYHRRELVADPNRTFELKNISTIKPSVLETAEKIVTNPKDFLTIVLETAEDILMDNVEELVKDFGEYRELEEQEIVAIQGFIDYIQNQRAIAEFHLNKNLSVQVDVPFFRGIRIALG